MSRGCWCSIPGELAPTDTADHAIDAFGMAGVTEVVLLGRRGPAEAAFTNPELRELGELERADVIVDPAQLEGVDVPEDGDTTKRRNVEILRDYAQRELAASHTGWSCGSCARRWRSSARARTGR